MRRCAMYLLSCLGVLSFSLSPAVAATVFVDSDASGPAHDGASWATAFATVAQGLGASTAGDEVWVAEGTYTETVTLVPGVGLYGGFAGTETERSQRAPATNETVLDGNKAGTVVTVPENAPDTTILDGFTVRNGSASGVRCLNGSAPVIRNNRITQNENSYGGAGVYCIAGRALIEANTISENVAPEGQGGGMILASGAPIVRANTIRNNTAGRGGGVFISGPVGPPSPEQALVEGNLMLRNVATSFGGGLYCMRAEPLIVGNRIEGNACPGSGRGGGFHLTGAALSDPIFSPRIIGNVIRANRYENILVYVPAYSRIIGNVIAGSLVGIEALGGTHIIANNTIANHSNWGISLGTSPLSDPRFTHAADVLNNVVAYNGNRVGTRGQTVAYSTGGITYHPKVNITVRRNCFFSNRDDSRLTADNLYADPQLADPAHGDLHIQPTSPCRDAGADFADLSDLRDIDGQPRIQGASVDIGTDESDGTVPVVTFRVVRVKPDGDDVNDGSSWQAAKRTVQAAIDAAVGAGAGDVWVAGGIYRERIIVPPFIYLYGGFAGHETSRDQRGAQNASILDGEKGGTVVTVNGARLVNTVDGFTITNGAGTYGGGVYGESLTLSNNVITGNLAEFGGGIRISGTCVLQDNRIWSNTATKGAGGMAFQTGHMVAERNSIVANVGGSVGGVMLAGSTSGFHVALEEEVTFRNNLIAGNQGSEAGGISVDSAAVTMANNTIVANTSANVGAMVGSSTARMSLANNLIAHNAGSSAIYVWWAPVLRHNGFFEQSPLRFVGLADYIGKNGNIAAAPLFVDAANGDYHLLADSPHIDAGDDRFVEQGELDADGRPRIQGSHVDMGAYEVAGPVGYRWWDVVLALRIAGGLEVATPEMVDRLGTATGETTTVSLAAAIRIARKASGLDANP